MNLKPEDETEIKIEITPDEMEEVRQRLKEFGLVKSTPRLQEENLLFDYSNHQLARTGCALRLRKYGEKSILTFKGPKKKDPLLKIRKEIESEVSDFNSIKNILEAVGFRVSFEYGKFREKYKSIDQSSPVEICVDETPVGTFIEIEGSREKIHEIASLFKWGPERFIQKNYIDLYRERTGQ